MSQQGNEVFRFADCELDPRERRLLVRGVPVTLTPKVFDTLVLLVERAGHVVSKDELMAALWPRGFVHESNLTKHIWLIRKALGDEGGGDACIETVSKLGYRFTAPVERVVVEDERVRARSVDVLVATAPAATRPARRVSRWWGMGALTAGVLLLVIGVFGWHHDARRAPMAGAPGSVDATSVNAASVDQEAVAIIGFSNLSRNPKDAWLGPALEQMLATEMSAGGTLHAVPDELVRAARSDSDVPAAGGYTAARLAALRQRLGAHYILSGSYFVSGTGGAPQLRIDLAMQDANDAHMVATLSRTGAVAELPQLMTRTGADLRTRFGIRSVSDTELQQVANANPPTADVARHIGFGLDALRNYDPARARDELLQAIAQAPGYAPAYASLATAWSALGYRAKAVAAIGQAVANAGDLPQEQRLQIDAQQATFRSDWPQAARLERQLVALRPRNPGYRLGLVGVLLNTGEVQAAEAELAALRKQSSDASDPRIELAAAAIALARNDTASRARHARTALAQARARGETGLVASAELEAGIAVGTSNDAEPLLRHAAIDFRKMGNPHGEALSIQNLANLYLDQNKNQIGRETYQRAMAIYQQIGDLGGEAAIYDNLTRLLWASGDRDGAEMAVRQALRIAQQTDDLPRQAWSLSGLATILSEDDTSDAIANMYDQALDLDMRSGERNHHAFVQASYADLLRQRGDLDRARTTCVKAQDEAHALNDASMTMSADFECAQIALDRGDVDSALAGATSVLTSANAAQDTFDAANAQLMLGQIAMGRMHWGEAKQQFEAALKGWTTLEEVAGQAVAQGQLALCASALGDNVARDRAQAAAHGMRNRITQRAEVASLDIALAQLQGEAGDRAHAIEALHSLAADAEHRGWPGLALESRLTELGLLQRWHDPGAGALRGAIDKSARARGYGWVLARLPHASA